MLHKEVTMLIICSFMTKKNNKKNSLNLLCSFWRWPFKSKASECIYYLLLRYCIVKHYWFYTGKHINLQNFDYFIVNQKHFYLAILDFIFFWRPRTFSNFFSISTYGFHSLYIKLKKKIMTILTAVEVFYIFDYIECMLWSVHIAWTLNKCDDAVELFGFLFSWK